MVVRGLQSLGAPVERADATARVALNLRGVAVEELSRGDALLTPGAFRSTDVVDVTLAGGAGGPAARRAGRARRVGDGRRAAAAAGRRRRPAAAGRRRCRCGSGDRLLLRDPGTRRVLGADVRDVDPPELRRRGAARQRAAELAAQPAARPGRRPTWPAAGSSGPTTSSRWAGRCPPGADGHGPWLLAAGLADELAARVPDVVARTARCVRWSRGRRSRWCAGR